MDQSNSLLGVPKFKLPIKIGSKSLIIIGVVIILLVAGGVGFWYFRGGEIPSLTPEPDGSPEEAPTLGSEIFDKTQNPLEGQVPDTNPFKDQKNPLDTIYKNPFE